jgi:(R,R)-butanediol dehydrogenase/meso-butanediol dehydrogenase/diacetyl reductase
MKAVRFHRARDVRYEDCSEPNRLEPTQLLVRPILCGICGTDLHEYIDGPHWTPKERNLLGGAELPQILGHEFSGQVLATGDAVHPVKVGDRVSIQPIIGLSNDYYGQRGMFLFSRLSAVVGLTWPWGGMAEVVLVNDYNAVKLPQDLSDEEGALIEPTAVAVQAIDRSQMKSGDTVLVTGGGPIGALTAMVAQASGAGRVLISQSSSGRRMRLEQMSIATRVLDPYAPEFVDTVRMESFDGRGVDVAIECSGHPDALQQCIDAVRPMGTVVIAGVIHDDVRLDPMQWFAKGINIHATNGYPIHIWPRVISMIQSGNLPVDKLIDTTIEARYIVEQGFVPLMDGQRPLMKILVRI